MPRISAPPVFADRPPRSRASRRALKRSHPPRHSIGSIDPPARVNKGHDGRRHQRRSSTVWKRKWDADRCRDVLHGLSFDKDGKFQVPKTIASLIVGFADDDMIFFPLESISVRANSFKNSQSLSSRLMDIGKRPNSKKLMISDDGKSLEYPFISNPGDLRGTLCSTQGSVQSTNSVLSDGGTPEPQYVYIGKPVEFGASLDVTVEIYRGDIGCRSVPLEVGLYRGNVSWSHDRYISVGVIWIQDQSRMMDSRIIPDILPRKPTIVRICLEGSLLTYWISGERFEIPIEENIKEQVGFAMRLHTLDIVKILDPE